MPGVRARSAALFAVAALAAVGLALAAAAPTSTELSIYNTGWDGLSRLATDLGPAILSNLTQASSLDPASTALIVPLIRPLTAAEVEALSNYTLSGGLLVILDEAGYSAPLLEALGVGVRVEVNATVMDQVVNLNGSRFHPLAEQPGGGLRVALDKPRPLEVTRGSDVLLETSPYSYIDIDGDGYYTPGEPLGPVPVAVRARVGLGEVVVIADTGFVMNYLYAENAAFIHAVIGDRAPALDQSVQLRHPLDRLRHSMESSKAPEAISLALLAAASLVSGYASRIE